VIVTSDKCYENDERQEPYSEEAVLGGLDPYSSSKACAEFVIRAYRHSFFEAMHGRCCRIASARAGNVIGGGDWSENRLIPDLVRAATNGISAPIRNTAGVRPWQQVLEPLSGYIRLAESLASVGGRAYAQAWNFGPSEEDCRPVSYLVDSFMSAWGDGARWHRAASEVGPEAGILKIDSSKALSGLGWRRRLNLDSGLDWTVDWYCRQRHGADAESITIAQIERYESLEECALA
jgi:CDP-glucose 4,6-dehydratase